MLKIFKKKKLYDFKYEILWKNGSSTIGEVKNSKLSPYGIFLANKMTHFGDKTIAYFNRNEIEQMQAKGFIEKEEK